MIRPVATSKTRIKICGVTTMGIAEAAAEAGADAIGLVFAPDSPRTIFPGAAYRLVGALPPFMIAVGVFQDPPDPELKAWPGPWVQLHGNEDEHQIRRVAQTKKIIRGFPFDEEEVRRWDACTFVSALLIDGPGGGGGRAFRHEELAELMPHLHKPVILAGGLTPDTVGDAIRTVQPFAVDVSSGVESSRGKKSPRLIHEFCDSVREADTAMGAER